MDFICIKDCNNSTVIRNTDKIFFYKKWEIYQYYITGNFERNSIYQKSIYCGWVTNDLIKLYFMPMKDFELISAELHGYFEGCFI